MRCVHQRELHCRLWNGYSHKVLGQAGEFGVRAPRNPSNARKNLEFIRLLFCRSQMSTAPKVSLICCMPSLARQICRHFLEGKCTYGDNCRFDHMDTPKNGPGIGMECNNYLRTAQSLRPRHLTSAFLGCQTRRDDDSPLSSRLCGGG